MRKKKLYVTKGMRCDFCQRMEHTIHFCPSLPTRPDVLDRERYVEDLLYSPRHRTSEYEGMSWEEAWHKVDNLGVELNDGNPCGQMIRRQNHISAVSWDGGKP